MGDHASTLLGGGEPLLRHAMLSRRTVKSARRQRRLWTEDLQRPVALHVPCKCPASRGATAGAASNNGYFLLCQKRGDTLRVRRARTVLAPPISSSRAFFFFGFSSSSSSSSGSSSSSSSAAAALGAPFAAALRLGFSRGGTTSLVLVSFLEAFSAALAWRGRGRVRGHGACAFQNSRERASFAFSFSAFFSAFSLSFTACAGVSSGAPKVVLPATRQSRAFSAAFACAAWPASGAGGARSHARDAPPWPSPSPPSWPPSPSPSPPVRHAIKRARPHASSPRTLAFSFSAFAAAAVASCWWRSVRELNRFSAPCPQPSCKKETSALNTSKQAGKSRH